VFRAWLMAILAGLAFVFAAQQEVGARVVEAFFVQRHDPGVTALVIRVALAASLRFEAAMKSLFRPHIQGNGFVAIKA